MQDVRVGIPSMRWETREPFDDDVSPSEPVLPPIAWVDGWTMCSFVTGRCWEIESINSHFHTFPAVSIPQIEQDPTQKAHDSQLRMRINRFYLGLEPTLAHAIITRCEEWCQDAEKNIGGWSIIRSPNYNSNPVIFQYDKGLTKAGGFFETDKVG